MRARPLLAVATLSLAALAATSLTPAPAHAFCGFYVAPSDGPLYNDATQVALMREGTRTVISMSNNYKGPASDFAMVVPVPVVLQKENVKTLPLDTFKKLEALSAPRLVEYWEQDPCNQDEYEKEGAMPTMAAPSAADGAKAESRGYGVKIEAKFSVGEYQILILSAKDSDGLERWLTDNQYKIPAGASAALAPYVREQMKFFVAKIDATKTHKDAQGVVVLSPLRFHYEETSFKLPVRLGLLNAPAKAPQGQQSAPAKQDLIVYVLGENKRYEVANYPNVFIPTNLDVKDETRQSFGPFYATLFDATIAKAGGKAIVTEYSWQSNGCDPCPTPPLEDSDVATLGGDVLFGMGAPAPSNQGGPAQGGYYGGSSRPVVLTRLHTRYDASTLSEDLVFRAASPVVGGREFVVDDHGNLEQGAKPSEGDNNFQARYAIRHPWTGPVACQNPRRGVWGGPPQGTPGDTAPLPATNLAGTPRGKLVLTSFVTRGLDDAADYDKALGNQPVTTNGPGGLAGGKRSCLCSTPGGGDAGSTLSGPLGAGVALALAGLARRASRRARRP